MAHLAADTLAVRLAVRTIRACKGLSPSSPRRATTATSLALTMAHPGKGKAKDAFPFPKPRLLLRVIDPTPSPHTNDLVDR